MSSELPPRVVDTRKSPRRRVVLAGKVVYNKGAFSVDCRIRDISESGARIVIPGNEVIPTRVVLLDVRNRIAYEAEVVRIVAPEYALRFAGAHSMSGELPPHLLYLKRFG